MASLFTIQSQINFLAAVVLQNWQGLDVLAAAQGGICTMLQGVCCFGVNQTGQIQNHIHDF